MASAAWEHRNAAARAKGYEGYYDYRVHDSGRIAPGVPVTDEMRERNRGHRSIGDLIKLIDRLEPGEAIVLPLGVERGAGGRWTQVDVTVVFTDGRSREFVLRGRAASQQNLLRLRSALEEAGVTWLPAKSIDALSDADDEEPGDLEYFDVEDEVA